MKKYIYLALMSVSLLFINSCDDRVFDDDNVISSFDYEFKVSEDNINGNSAEFKGFYEENIPFILEISNKHELKGQIYDIEYQIIDDPNNVEINNGNEVLSGKFKSVKGLINLSLLAKSLGEKTVVLKCSNGNVKYDKQLRLKFNISTRTFEIVTEHIKSNDYLYPYPKKEYQSLGETQFTLKSDANFSTMGYQLYIKPKVFGTKGVFLYNNKVINFNEPITPSASMVFTYIPQSISKLEEQQTISFQVKDKFGNVIEKTVDYKVKLDVTYTVNWDNTKGKVIPQFNIEGIGKQWITNGAEKYQNRGNTKIVLNSKSDLSFYINTTGNSNLIGNLLLQQNSYPLQGNISIKEGVYQFVYVNRNTALQQESTFKNQNDITYTLGCSELDLPTISNKYVKKIEYKIYKVPTLISENSIRREAKRTNGNSQRYRKYYYSSHLKIEVEEEFNNGVYSVAIYGIGRSPKFNNVGRYIGANALGIGEKSKFSFEKSEIHFLYDPSQRRNSSLQSTFDIDDDIYYYIEDYNGIKTSYQGILKEGAAMDWGVEWLDYDSGAKGNDGKNNKLFLL